MLMSGARKLRTRRAGVCKYRQGKSCTMDGHATCLTTSAREQSSLVSLPTLAVLLRAFRSFVVVPWGCVNLMGSEWHGGSQSVNTALHTAGKRRGWHLKIL
jgi:hypothetical protein